MSTARIALLNASFAAESTRRNFRRELPASLAEFDVTGGDLPPSTTYDGIVVTGSRSSVYWTEPWIEQTKDYIHEAIDAGTPLLGVCWGHQLLADVLGGTVEDMGTYEIGYRHIERRGDDPLLAGIDRRFLAYTTHSDAVVEAPPSTDVIAENDISIQGFAGSNVWGVQFHPEYDQATASEVTEAKDDLDSDRKERALASITDENARRAGKAKLIFDNFVDIVTDR